MSWAEEYAEDLRARNACLICEKTFEITDEIHSGTFGGVSGDVHRWRCWTDYRHLASTPAFSGHDRLCPKCHGGVDTRWVALSAWKNGMLGLPEQLLKRECRSCGYQWSERTLDEGAE